MKYSILLLAFLSIFLFSCDKGKKDVKLVTDDDKISYSLGWTIGKRFKTDALQVDIDYIAKGIEDGLKGNALLSEKEVKDTMNKLRMKVMADRGKVRKEMSEKNFREGEAYLEANGKKEGVKTLPSGLQYKVVKKGQGSSPKATDRVSVIYRGTLIDGTEFDSSGKTPRTFPVNRVIGGWTEALQLMKPGSKWQLAIPSKLAYKERGSRNIGPNSTLLFDVELVEINPKTPAQPPHPGKRPTPSPMPKK